MVARILLNSRALKSSAISKNYAYQTYSVQETKRLVQILPERRIITAIAQNSRSSLNALAGKVLGKDLLGHLGALGGL